MASSSTRQDPKAAAIADLAKRAALTALDHKANDVVVLSLKGVSDMTDFFVIASGTSDTHVRSLGELIQQELKKDGAVAHHVEGIQQGRWVLLDYVDFVVHIFSESARKFYDAPCLLLVEPHHAPADAVDALAKHVIGGNRTEPVLVHESVERLAQILREVVERLCRKCVEHPRVERIGRRLRQQRERFASRSAKIQIEDWRPTAQN